MITLTFTAAACLFGLVALYHLWRFILRGFLPSLVAAVMPAGWVLVMARELKWLPRDIATPLIALGMTVGFLSVLIIIHHERQQPAPFR